MLFWRRRLPNEDTLVVSFNNPLWEATLNLSEVLLDSPNHYVIAGLLCDLYSPAESLWVKDFQKRRKTIGMSVVRGSRQEQSMLESWGERSDRVCCL